MVSRLHSVLISVHAWLLLWVTHTEENQQARKAPGESPAVTEECEMHSIAKYSLEIGGVSLGMLAQNHLV